MYLKKHLSNLLELIKKKKRVPVTCHSSQLKHGLSVVRLTGIVVHFNLRRGLNKKFEPLSSILEERPMIFVQNNNEVKNGIPGLAERERCFLLFLYEPFSPFSAITFSQSTTVAGKEFQQLNNSIK